MVGFGSSLRLARRPGWEGAYLDYETLKLWLSQIEAVYEEEGHSRMSRDAASDWEMEHDFPKKRRGSSSRRGSVKSAIEAVAVVRDYKDELFLEADSEAAYLSIDAKDEDSSADSGDAEAAEKVPQQPPTKPFSLSYSHQEQQLSSDEDDTVHKAALCWGKSGASEGSNGSKKPMKSKRKGSTLPALRDKNEDAFYNVTTASGSSVGATLSFYMTAPDGNVDDCADAATPSASNDYATSSSAMDYNTSLHYFPTATSAYPSEATSLLPTATSPQPTSASLFAFPSNNAGGSLSPPGVDEYSHRSNSALKPAVTFSIATAAQGDYGQSTSGDSFSSPKASVPMQPSRLYQQQPQSHQHRPKEPDVQRNRERRARRQKRQKLRAKRERKVPRHLRIAHSKARAITERFLGLLRAETEKVMLFAQSRLGELADTAGSLRFPSFDEEYASNSYNAQQFREGSHHPRESNAGAYEFGDGGMHPSASSSSDDGAGGGLGGRQWSDSSDADENHSNAVNSKANTNDKLGAMQSTKFASLPPTAMMMSMPQSFSGGGLSDETPTNITARTKDMEGMQLVRRQIAHFTALRKHRVLFQRNEQILGEDMLFLSALEEADGYTAVGVELMHVLKYICVNLIAVRKICRKHDRLLMNRMLGGYYQRIRMRGDAQNSYSHLVDGTSTLGGLIARISGDIYDAHPSLIGQTNHFKLVGVYDKKVQKLANSRTVQVVSSCLALSLSEYEVARSRADALTGLNSTASVGNAPSRMQTHGGRAAESDVDSVDDPPSTASSISLTRLQYTIMSIFALREVSRSKRDYFATFLSRATLTFTGQPVVGEGLDGCSRETLDFLVSYDPDAALLRDSSVLFDAIRQNQWARHPMGDVMISALAAATTPLHVATDVALTMLARDEMIVAHAVSAAPESKSFMLKSLVNGQLPKFTRSRRVLAKEIPPMALRLNRMSLFLYVVSFLRG